MIASDSIVMCNRFSFEFTNKTVHASGHSARSGGPVRLHFRSIAGSLRIYA
jgi:hypothetical protein